MEVGAREGEGSGDVRGEWCNECTEGVTVTGRVWARAFDGEDSDDAEIGVSGVRPMVCRRDGELEVASVFVRAERENDCLDLEGLVCEVGGWESCSVFVLAAEFEEPEEDAMLVRDDPSSNSGAFFQEGRR